jgi:soluble lytic murein transglycosylase-like protein
MNSHRATVRTLASRRGTVLSACLLAPALLLPAAAQTIQPQVENGRVVWTNDGASEHQTRSRRRSADSSGYAYWSNTERRWKPVRTASPRAMRSARAVAGEVSDFAARGANISQAAGDGRVSAEDIDRYIEEAAARHNVDPDLVRAVIKVESNFNPRAVSRKGAMGLMQLMPATARRYDVSNPFDARQNVDAGVRHLKGLLENFRGNVPLTLAAYNAGEGAVERSGGIPPYTETRNYVRRITHLLEDDSSLQTAGMPVPIRVYRDDRGRLVITNVE